MKAVAAAVAGASPKVLINVLRTVVIEQFAIERSKEVLASHDISNVPRQLQRRYERQVSELVLAAHPRNQRYLQPALGYHDDNCWTFIIGELAADVQFNEFMSVTRATSSSFE